MANITLPTGLQAFVIKLSSVEDLNITFLRRFDLSNVQRYICIVVETDGVKAFEMAIKEELKKEDVLKDLRETLEFQIAVLKQL